MEASIIVTNQPQTCRIGILTNHRWERPVVLNLGHSDFEIVSDSCPPSFWRIVLRISDFKLSAPLSPNSLIPCSADPLQPVPLIPRSLLLSLSPVSCLLSSVFCLLSSVSCLLSSVSCLLSPVSCLLSPVSCLLSSVSRLLSSVSRLLPYPPILPRLPALYKCQARSTNPPVFCKTKPMSKWAK